MFYRTTQNRKQFEIPLITYLSEMKSVMNIDSIPLQPTSSQVSAKSFGIRASAFIIDSVTAGIISFMISMVW